MASFIYTWNSTFLATPSDTEDASLGSQRIRDTKTAVGERFAVDHSLAGNANDGKHLKATLMALVSPVAWTLDSGDGACFSATVNGITEFFFQDSNGALTQITSNGTASGGVPIGTVMAYASNAVPTNWLWCNGNAYSRTTYAKLNTLLANAGYPYGSGDGSTTFNTPDLRGRFPLGQGPMGAASDPLRVTSAVSGINNAVLGGSGGNQNTQQHTHTDSGHQHTIGTLTPVSAGSGLEGIGAGSSSFTGLASANIQNYGTGTSQNMPPSLVMNFIIFAGS